MVFPRRNAQMTEAELAEQLPGCAASLAGSEPYTRAVIADAAAKGLKVIARAGVGYDGVDLDAATDHGVAVTFAPGTNQDAAAEHTFTLILALAKNLLPQHDLIKAGQWPRRTNRPLRGTTLGVVGLGRIGKAVGLRGEAFGMTVIATEPYPDRAFAEQHGIELVPLDDLFRRADWVTLHMPMLPESRQCVNRRVLELMKPTAYLINTARGGVVCEPDLYEALKAKRIAGAGLDVFEDEPPAGSPLLTLDNVVLTPHMAGVDLQSRDDMARLAANAIVKLLGGDWPADWVVNPTVKERFFAR
ncbi:MAG: phosphoglycerate dehydrogenase [Gemmataceae bacterium]|nr:phosphoglycerate dehydrogenase [Gemmataceae bacterium]